ncbi:MAG: TPM domain-containing protein, partial [Hymenobacteraceae bacterium]|nr:TPM domain-containing protein [Hymenobacteraceae bacterium]
MNPTISDSQIARIEEAVRGAERLTSGEVRVHIEEKRPAGQDALTRAVEIFHSLSMAATAERNGVLFYVATETRNFAVIGDAGIDDAVPSGFWDAVRDRVLADFRDARYADGLVAGLAL